MSQSESGTLINPEKLNQLPTEELVQIILTQQDRISHLKQEIEQLKLSRKLDSKISSKPPSSEIFVCFEVQTLVREQKYQTNSEKSIQG